MSRALKCSLPPFTANSKLRNMKNSRVLILGGTGRIGGSTALSLSQLLPDLQILIGGRCRERGAEMVKKLGKTSKFVELDINNLDALQAALQGNEVKINWTRNEFATGMSNLPTCGQTGHVKYLFLYGLGTIKTGSDVDLVVHAAGPFQQTEKCSVLEAAIHTKTAYVDVCDDTSYAFRAKSLSHKAMAANVQAITTAGICPGVSNVMAAELVRAAKEENKGEPERLRFSYYTTGTGGAGPTMLASSFLLLGEKVIAYNKGQKLQLKPYSGMHNVNFGKGIRKKDVFLLNLPEVRSAHELLGVPTVSARFGSEPFFWNWGMSLFATLLPREFLRDRIKVQQLVKQIVPIIQAVDGFVGECISMRVDLECSGGRNTVSILSHKSLSVSVGLATSAFVLAVLEGSTQPGVWFPEEPEGIPVEAREFLLERVSQGAFNFVMNKPSWMVETN